MGDLVIAAYRPIPGQEEALAELSATHVPYLRELGLVTDRIATTMCAADGTIIEVFEWRDGGVEAAHAHPAIHALWERYAKVCTYVPLNSLAEASQMFAMFKPL